MQNQEKRKIYKADLYYTGHGTHKFHCLFTGDWDEIDLITAVDNRVFDDPKEEDLKISHYGGVVKNYRVNGDGTQEAEVYVYYD